MKKSYVSALFFLIIFQAGSAGFANSADQPQPALVYFFRLPNYVGSAAKITIKSNDQPVVRLKNASFFKFEVQPGDYIFTPGMGSSSRVKLSVEAGKEYYIKCYYNMGFWSGIPILELVDPVSGKSTIEGNSLREQPYEPISTRPRTSRAGLIFISGFGFEDIPWFTDTDGNDINLSTGGGFGGEYGRMFSKHFDLSFNCFYQGSSLIPYTKNVSATFRRMAINITPSYVIPIKGGEILRLKLGVGAGIYCFGTMKVDATYVNGGKYNFKYNSAPGVHGLILLESNFMERGSVSFGMKYSNIRYHYDTSNSLLILTDHKVASPDGSGFDIFMGYSFLF
jgi:hypothetical protein